MSKNKFSAPCFSSSGSTGTINLQIIILCNSGLNSCCRMQSVAHHFVRRFSFFPATTKLIHSRQKFVLHKLITQKFNSNTSSRCRQIPLRKHLQALDQQICVLTGVWRQSEAHISCTVSVWRLSRFPWKSLCWLRLNSALQSYYHHTVCTARYVSSLLLSNIQNIAGFEINRSAWTMECSLVERNGIDIKRSPLTARWQMDYVQHKPFLEWMNSELLSRGRRWAVMQQSFDGGFCFFIF